MSKNFNKSEELAIHVLVTWEKNTTNFINPTNPVRNEKQTNFRWINHDPSEKRISKKKYDSNFVYNFHVSNNF